MEQLEKDWLTRGLIDYEYKKYILLAYLKDIRAHFDHNQLYPFMSDLVFHYKNIVKVRASKDVLYEHFPKTLSEADFKKLRLTYEQVVQDDEVMKELEQVIEFALPEMENALEEGKEIHEFVEENIEIVPVGLSPLYEKEGYLFINQFDSADVEVFRYQVSFFEKSDEKYRSIATSFVRHDVKSISRTYESIKLDLVKRFRELPNPATFLAISKLGFPLMETFLPVAKRMLVRNLAA